MGRDLSRKPSYEPPSSPFVTGERQLQQQPCPGAPSQEEPCLDLPAALAPPEERLLGGLLVRLQPKLGRIPPWRQRRARLLSQPAPARPVPAGPPHLPPALLLPAARAGPEPPSAPTAQGAARPLRGPAQPHGRPWRFPALPPPHRWPHGARLRVQALCWANGPGWLPTAADGGLGFPTGLLPRERGVSAAAGASAAL